MEALIEETLTYFEDRNLALFGQNIEALRASGEIEEAKKMALEFKTINISSHNLDDYILYPHQIRAKKKQPPVTLITPGYVRDSPSFMARRDVEKLLRLAINTLGFTGTMLKAEIGEWKVKHPAELFIDGKWEKQQWRKG